MTEQSETKQIYRGWATEGDHGENFDAFGLEEKKEMKYVTAPLADLLEDDRDFYGPYATVRYFVADEERTSDQLEENLVKQLVGSVDARYHDHYSEITGYLWTDEDIEVGGHDLLEELRSCKGRFVHLEITWSKTGEQGS